MNRDRLMTDLVVSSCVLACLSVSSSATNPRRHADLAHTYANSVEATSGIEPCVATLEALCLQGLRGDHDGR